MKTRHLIVGLAVLIALGGWIARADALLAEANNNLADLDKKIAAVEHETAVAQAEILKQKVALESGSPAHADSQTALAAAQAMPPGAARDSAMQAAIMAAAAADPQAAWDLVKNLPEVTNDYRMNTLKNVLGVWSASDPIKAIAMLATLPPAWAAEISANRNDTTGVIESNWLKTDPVAASQWIDTLPPGNTRDSAILALVDTEQGSDPALAFTWASTLNAYNVQQRITASILSKWAATDPATATKAVLAAYPGNNSGTRAALLAIIQQAASRPAANP